MLRRVHEIAIAYLFLNMASNERYVLTACLACLLCAVIVPYVCLLCVIWSSVVLRPSHSGTQQPNFCTRGKLSYSIRRQMRCFVGVNVGFYGFDVAILPCVCSLVHHVPWFHCPLCYLLLYSSEEFPFFVIAFPPFYFLSSRCWDVSPFLLYLSFDISV